MHLAAAWGAPAIDLPATVAHVTRGIAGLSFDVSRRERYEAMLDRVDRLTLSTPELGVFAAHVVLKLDRRAVLTASNALAAAAVSEPERRFLKQLGEGRTLDDVARGLGAEWERMRHLPFALLQRGLVKLRGSQTLPPPSAALSRANVRPEQAERYVQSAAQLLATGDKKQARVNLLLALALAPKDAEIEALLALAQNDA